MKKAFVIFMLALLSMGMLLSGVKLPTANAVSQSSINNAIQKGLAYLNKTQASDGHWGDGSAPVACTAMAVLAYENAPNNHFGWNLTDPYHITVQKGLDWLFANAYVQTLSVQPAGNPDTNGNGIGIYFDDGSGQLMYETPMVLMVIIASQAPTNVTTTGPVNVTGRAYHDIAVDVVDYLAWAQNEGSTGRGGWRYGPNYGDSDNSVSQWPVIGLMAAELWNIPAPAWVQTELLKWITTDQYLGGNSTTNSVYGAFDYQPGRGLDTPADTATGILELTYCGFNTTDPRIIAAEGYLNRDWNPNGYCHNGDDYGWNWNIGDLYDMYAVMKACRLTTPTPVRFIANYDGTNGAEWYNGTGEYADALIAHQGGDGSWNNWVSVAEGVVNDLGTAWGVLILEYVPVKVTYKFTVAVVDAVTSNPIVGATVFANGPETHLGTTGPGGTIVFDKIQAGSYKVNASSTGYYPSTPQTVLVTDDTAFTIKLQPIPVSVVPEVPIGTIAALVLMMMAMLGYLAMPRLKRKLK